MNFRATLEKGTIQRTCVLPAEGAPYAKTYSGKDGEKGMEWQSSVLGRNGKEYVIFLKGVFRNQNGGSVTIREAWISDGREWRLLSKIGPERFGELLNTIFSEEEFRSLESCTFRSKES